MRFLLDFLFPKTRRVIELEGIPASELVSILPPAEHIADEDAIAIFEYAHGVVKDLVWQVKYAGNRTIARKLSTILNDVIQTELGDRLLDDTLLIPIPISDRRRFERGWNQAELLCEAIHLKYLPGQLVKARHTGSQTRTTSRQERLANIKDSMKVNNPDKVRDRNIVLVDDVYTTGATFAEAKRALKEAGARKVLCFAIAH